MNRGDTMSAHTPEAAEKQKTIYKAVGAALMAGTIVTVLAASVHLGIVVGIAVALIIATVKGSLVAGYFMHLFSEKKLIYGVLALTAVFVIALLGLILSAYRDQQGHPHGIFQVPQRHVQPHHEAPAASATAEKGDHVP
jgi:cytochrome c oxidase subunit IV